MKTKKIKINWGDEVVLPNGQIVQPKMLTPDESRVLNTRFMPAWQREFNDGKRDAYRRAMSAGLWNNDNMSVIRLTPNGEVCDGGHRTSAAALANYALCSLLIKNVPPEIFITTDIQKTRGSSVFISGTDRTSLATLATTFYRATLGLNPINSAGVSSHSGSIDAAFNTNDPAAFLHANRAEIEEYVKIASCMRSRTHNTVSNKMWGLVAAIARVKSGSDTWVYSIQNNSSVIADIKDYLRDAEKKHIAMTMRNTWIFCRLMSDFREKSFRGSRWNVRQIAQLLDAFAHALKGHFNLPKRADYKGAAEDLFRYAAEAAARKAAKEAASC